MKFHRMPTIGAEGALLAHSLRSAGISFKKGRKLDAADAHALLHAGIDSIVAAQLEAGDVGEDAAAEQVTLALRGANLVASAPFTGRCNLYANTFGLLTYVTEQLDALNLVDEAVTIAALPPHALVQERQMVATIKIIPYGVAAATLQKLTALSGANQPLFRVAAFAPMRIGLIQTRVEGSGDKLFKKTRMSVQARVEALGSRLTVERHCAHHEDEIAAAMRSLLSEDCELLLIAGASATADRRDVVPSGIEKAGGNVLHVGMPVEPGNLLLLGEIAGGRPVICLPGCARSPALNGFDWVLQRLLARIPVTRQDVMRMGAGGLIKHQEQARGARAAASESLPARPQIGAVVLAAGRPPRQDGTNRLLERISGEAVVRRAVRVAEESQADSVVVVLGHEAERICEALAGCKVQFVENPDYQQGLSSSLRLGLDALPAGIQGAIICLGDMPWVSSTDIDRLIAAFSPDDRRLICIASHRGHRGHPVLWGEGFFDEMRQLRDEEGAKSLLLRHAEVVCEVDSPNSGVLRDPVKTATLPLAG